MTQFQAWFEAAIEAGVREPEAMSLTTAATTSSRIPGAAIPSTRIVLLKQSDPRGFVFYTNYSSRKSKELIENPYASLCFYWREIHRSVRVVGKVEKISNDESDEYFGTRPRGSQIGAWASPQSNVVKEGELAARVKHLERKFPDGQQVQRPEGWGGWRVVPFEVEFWEGKPSRLHNRVRYLANDKEAGAWEIDRLAP
ncbi:pyridoxamine 5'-phosphate oxidase [Dacryopinax primogenitus]|uniref:pyridoxal 5'-phosphate synthase n=1 Tax=Dacryopinax primogenitus (strain DJM 731) TaxID=1858805 RepID=M5FSI0_DACPD|nr:pyridoxamine 5'-phosphate oxidase [Dacryopinax primogenitus]EJT98838.1 pyridoxamine 5'-phosphate oxidase [Dacryopinax primogenitus]